MFEISDFFFANDMFFKLVEQTNLSVNRDRNRPNFKVDLNEIRNFIGLLIIGYHRLRENDYWCTADDMEKPIFSKTMSKERFRNIKMCL